MIPTITIHITGDERVARRLGALGGAFVAANEAVIRPLGDRYVDVLRAETPQGRGERPGRLRAGYETEERYTATAGRYHITNRTPHVGYVLKGRGPVVARRGRALRFVIDGQVIFRRWVGPAAPNPFDERARRAMQGEIDRARVALAGAMVRAYQGGA